MAKIAFVQNTFYEYFGLMYISALLKQSGHQVEMFLSNSFKKNIKGLKNFGPDIVGFSSTTGAHKWYLSLAKQIKSQINAKIILGGPHPTFFPEVIDKGALDAICLGEGEYALLELADRVSRDEDISSIKNLWIKKGEDITKNNMRLLIADLDSLPFPDREIYYKKYPYLNRSQKAFFTARGCPFKCSFCFEEVFRKMTSGLGKHVRVRSIKNVIDEMLYLKKKYPFKTVYIQDDTFILNKEWVFEFLDQYRSKVNLPFICLVRADLMNIKIAEALKRAGCSNVFFGVETGDEGLRNNLLRKGESDEHIFRTASLLKENSIKFRTYNMVGLPGETIEQAFKTVNLNIKIKTDYPWCSVFQPYPKTELGEYARKNGYLGEISEDFNPSFFRTSPIISKDSYEFINLQKLFFYAVKFPKLKPLIFKTIKLRPNIVFELFFLIGYAYSYLGSEKVTFREMVSVGLRNVRSFFFRQ